MEIYENWKCSYKLVSLLEVLRFNAAFFVTVCTYTQSLRAEVEFLSRPLGIETIERLDRWLERLRAECQEHSLPVSAGYIDQVLAYIESLKGQGKEITKERFITNMNGIEERICQELHDLWFFRMPDENVGFYEGSRERFGQKVIDAFPNAMYDIEEAGKCFALGRSTATVFHLMRVMEIGLFALGKSLNDPNWDPHNNRSWHSILHKCDKEIAKKKEDRAQEWKEDEEFYMSVTANIHAVKNAWRNPTMHVGKKYTNEEAADIFNAVRTFMRHLATKLQE